jgi:hypothetical protein
MSGRINTKKARVFAIYCLRFCVLALSVLAISPEKLSAQAQAPSCQTEDGHPLAICFSDPPLSVEHCDRKLIPHMNILRKNDEQYYFTYRIFIDGKLDPPNSDPIDDFRGQYQLSIDDPEKENQKVNIDFNRAGSYQIEVTAHVKGSAPLTQLSKQVPLEDKSIVRAIVIGISQYENGKDDPGDSEVQNLLHADSDAKAFASFVSQAFPTAHPILITSDGDTKPLKGAILKELEQIPDDVPRFCGPDDWFIFYFSGHGILANDGAEIRHYISTMNLSPSDLRKTAINLKLLLDDVMETHATNKLIVLDSCFSGNVNASPPVLTESRASNVQISRGINRSSRAIFVERGKFVPGFDISPTDTDTDIRSIQRALDDSDVAKKALLYIAAASVNEKAREGLVTYTNGNLDFKGSNQEIATEKDKGHGLYTYSLLLKLEEQVSTKFHFTDVLGADHVISNGDVCKIDFWQAYNSTVTLLGVLRNSRDSLSDTQNPNGIPSKQPLKVLSCRQ